MKFIRGRAFVLDAIARDRPRAEEIAAYARRLGLYARVTQVGPRGMLSGDGERVRQAWAVWTRPRQLAAG